MSSRSRRVWKKDCQGKYARHIGWKTSRSGKRTQQKFRLGEDLRVARRREQQLEELWERVVKDTAEGTLPSWDAVSLEVAQQIAGDCALTSENSVFRPLGNRISPWVRSRLG
jgi:hypothetical protein